MSLDEPTQPVRIHESLLPRDHSLHRPRHSGRQRTAFCCALVFFMVPALAFVLGVRPQQIENHKLATLPAISDGFRFFQELGNWATDNLPLRDAGIHAEAGVSNGIFGEPPQYSRNERPRSGAPLGPVSPPPDTGNVPEIDGFPQVIEGKDGWMYYGYDMQGKCQPVRPLAATIAALRTLRRAVEASGRTFVLVVAPDKSTEVPQYLPDDYAGKSCATPFRLHFWEQVTGDAGAIDLRRDLRVAGKRFHTPVYFRLGTHWTGAGSLTMLWEVSNAIAAGTTDSWLIQRVGQLDGPADLPPMLGERGSITEPLFSLAPHGGPDQTRDTPLQALHQPHVIRGSSGVGTISTPTAFLGDSFLVPELRYLPAIYTDSTAYYYEDGATHPATLNAVVNRSKVVVLEAVERNLAAGQVSLLSPAPLQGLVADLRTHPLR